jgi:hypothetical protein
MTYDDNRHQHTTTSTEDAAPASEDQPTTRARPRTRRRKVGYKNPPKEHQWQAGMASPNPKGRPRYRSINETTHRFLNAPAGASGELAKITRYEFLLHMAFKKVGESNLEAMRMLKQWGSEAEAGIIKEFTAKLGALINGFDEGADEVSIMSRINEYVEVHAEDFHVASKKWPEMYQNRMDHEAFSRNDPFDYQPQGSINVAGRLNEMEEMANAENKKLHDLAREIIAEQKNNGAETGPAVTEDLATRIRRGKPMMDKIRKKSPQQYAAIVKAWNEIILDHEPDKEQSKRQKKDTRLRARRR